MTNAKWLDEQIDFCIVQYNEALRHDDKEHANFWLDRWRRLAKELAKL